MLEVDGNACTVNLVNNYSSGNGIWNILDIPDGCSTWMSCLVSNVNTKWTAGYLWRTLQIFALIIYTYWVFLVHQGELRKWNKTWIHSDPYFLFISSWGVIRFVRLSEWFVRALSYQPRIGEKRGRHKKNKN